MVKENIDLNLFISFLIKEDYPSKERALSEISNTQTAFLCGNHSKVDSGVAFNNLKNGYRFYSTTETLPFLVKDLEGFFNKKLYMPHSNTTSAKISIEEKTLRAIVELNEQDIKLYSRVFSELAKQK